MSAGLMDLLLAGHGEVLLVAGQENNWSHQQRVDGFQTEAAANFPGLTCCRRRPAVTISSWRMILCAAP